MEQLFVFFIAILLVFFSVAGGVIKRIIRTVRARKRRREAEVLDQPEELRRGPVSYPLGEAQRGLPEAAAARDDAPGYPDRWSRPTEQQRAKARRSTGLARIEMLPPLKRAIVLSEVLGKPASEREHHPWD